MFRQRDWRPVVWGPLLLAGTVSTVSAQFQFPQRADEGLGANAQFVPQNRQLQTLLDRAREQLAGPEEDQRRGLELVQQIIDDAEDYFSDTTFRGSVRESAERLLANLPESGRRLYEQIYGAEAQAMLHNPAQARAHVLPEVVRRFFFTQAGGKAAVELAAIEMDRGHALAAARLFERLGMHHERQLPDHPELWKHTVLAYWKAGHARESQTLLLRALANAEGALTWNGRDVPPFANPHDALAWLNEQFGPAGSASDFAVNDWLLAGGTSDRNASVRPASPVFDTAWRTSLLGARDVRTPEGLHELQIAVERVQAFASEYGPSHRYSVFEPLVVGDTIVFSSYGRIKAVDARTGQFRWQAADADPVFAYLAHHVSPTPGPYQTNESTLIDDLLAQRAWLDATSASLSSDGRRIYEVFDSGMIGPFREQRTYAASSTHPLTPRPDNRLRAYEIETDGKLLWEVGGPSGRVSLPLGGTYFLGAPLPVDDELYVLGEERGQVRLIVMDAPSGDVQWSLPLLNVAEDVDNNLERRLAGLSPALAGGLLICPTGGGMLVAVDRLRRTLVWGHVYNEPQHEVTPHNFARGFRQIDESRVDTTSTEDLLAARRWHGASTLIAGPFVIHAPCDHAELHCVRLLDGRSVWTRPRQRTLCAAGIYDEAVILLGERNVEAVQLATGKSLWALPLGMPSGRGVRDGAVFHVPLRGGEIASIDLQAGRLLALSPTRSGAELGSLIAAGGRLFSQTASELRGFRSLDELHQQIAADLAANSNDPAALAVRGELQMHIGETDAGLADLRSSFAAAPDDRVKGLIVDALLERLSHDFVAHQETIPELERLTSDPQQRVRMIRTIAEGLEAEGEWREAYARYLQLLSTEGLEHVDEHVDEQRTVRMDRWVQGRLQRIYERATPDQRAPLDVITNQAVDESIAGGDLDRLERAVSAFRQHPAGARALDKLTDVVDPQQRPLRAEALLLARRRDGTAPQRASAVARLAQLYADHDRGDLVDLLLKELEQQYADVLLADGQNGRDLADDLRKQSAFTSVLSNLIDWPTQSMEVSKRQEGARQQLLHPIQQTGQSDPLFAGASFHFDTREVTGHDGLGRPEWSVRLQSATGSGFSESQFIERRGHLALLFLGNRFHILEMLRHGVEPRVIVADDVVEHSSDTAFGQPSMIRPQQLEGMGLRGDLRRDNVTLEFLGNTGPLRSDLFCYQKGGTLHALDPLTGDELWHVDETPRGCEIFADESYVILVPPNQRPERWVAHILRAADGEFVATRRLPSDLERDRQQADWGRLFLTSRREVRGRTLAMFDPVSGENLWERLFPQFQTWAPLDGYDLLVLNKDGLLQRLDPLTGETLLEVQTKIEDDIQSMTVTSHPQQWFLFTERSSRSRYRSQLIHLPRRNFRIADGPACGFDRQTGRMLWNREILGLMVDPALPGRWPLLVLSSQASAVPGGRRSGPSVRFQNLLVLNKHTGDVVFEGDGDGDSRGQSTTSWVIQDKKPQLLLSFSGTGLAVSFSDSAQETLRSPHEDEANREVDRTPPPPTVSPPDDEEN